MNSAAPSGAAPGPGLAEPASEATVLRMLLGAQLRRLREAADISAEDAGYEIRASRSKVSHMETERVGLKLRDIEDLLTLYGVLDPDQRARVIALARRTRRRSGGPGTTTSCPAGSRPTSALSPQPPPSAAS